MRIAYICHRFYPYLGGVETHVYEIARKLSNKYNVEILTTDPTGRLNKIEKIDNIIIRRFKAIAPSGAYYFSYELYRFLKENSKNYDVLHIHNYHSLTSFLGAISKSKNKIVFTPHYHERAHSLIRNLFMQVYNTTFGKKIFKLSDKIICVSEYEKSLILRKFDVIKKIEVIPNGINVEDFQNFGKVTRENNTILYVGRLEKYKGVQYLIQALKYLNDWKLIIVGTGSYKQNLINLSKKLNVYSRIQFLKNLPRKELIKLYKKATIFALLSKHEAYGITVAEALLAKTPCVVAEASALKEWIDNQNVYGVEYPIDAKKLAETIKEAAYKKVRLTKKLKKKILSWDDVAKKIQEIYLSI